MLKVDKEICRSRVSLTSFLEDVQNVFHRKKSIAVVVRNSLYYKWLHIQCRFLQMMEMLRLWQYADLRPQPCIFLKFSMAHILWQWRKLNGLDFNWIFNLKKELKQTPDFSHWSVRKYWLKQVVVYESAWLKWFAIKKNPWFRTSIIWDQTM